MAQVLATLAKTVSGDTSKLYSKQVLKRSILFNRSHSQAILQGTISGKYATLRKFIFQNFGGMA